MCSIQQLVSKSMSRVRFQVGQLFKGRLLQITQLLYGVGQVS